MGFPAPGGTVTVSEVAVAAVTVAFTPPNQTVLLDGFDWKFTPEMVREAPIAADSGEIFVT